MVAIQDNLQNFKTYIKSNKFKLLKEVNNLEEDVNLYSEKVSDWSTKVKVNEFPAVSNYKQNAMFIKHRVKVIHYIISLVLCI